VAHYWPGRSLYELYCDPPTMSLVELRRFVRYLPPESATAREIFPKSKDDLEQEFWAQPADRSFMASLIDAVRESTFVQIKLHGDPKRTRNLKPPEPIERPGVQPRQKVIRFGGRHGAGDLGQVMRARPAS
jgi:hypothetical protein